MSWLLTQKGSLINFLQGWLEDRVGALENKVKTSTFTAKITNGATEGEAEKTAKDKCTELCVLLNFSQE